MAKRGRPRKIKEPVEIVAVVDRSGSMLSLVDEAIKGYNSFINNQKNLPGEANLTLVLFDHEIIMTKGNIQAARQLNERTYIPRGMTALNDAIGKAIMSVNDKNNVIMCILTDGLENSSKEFGSENIKKLIEDKTNKGWEFVFLAANQKDIVDTATNLGIRSNNTIAFSSSPDGIKSAYASMDALSMQYRSKVK